jgi:hypothetical protein
MFTRGLVVVLLIALMGSGHRVANAGEGEETEAPESAVSSPPMEMDDPGTPGSNGIEVNFVGTMLHAAKGRGSESLFDANYGIGDRLQLKFERPYLTEIDEGVPYQQGVGATELGVKWRFVDHAGLEIAVYPQYEFNDAFVIEDAEGNAEDTEGSSLFIPVLVSKTLGRVYTVAANAGYRHNVTHELDDWSVGVGAGRALGNCARVLGEIYSVRDDHLGNVETDVRAGLAGVLFPSAFEKSKFELGEFASVGRSIGATETGAEVTSVTFGFQFIMKPAGE